MRTAGPEGREAGGRPEPPQEDVAALVRRLVDDEALTGATLSRPRRSDPSRPVKVTVAPVAVGGDLRYRFTFHEATRARDENLTADAAAGRLVQLVETEFRQCLLQSIEADWQVLTGGKAPKILRRPPTRPARAARAHDRVKRRLLPDGVPVPFLVELGVMTPDGKVRARRYDKYRQVNRFLELVEDVLPALGVERVGPGRDAEAPHRVRPPAGGVVEPARDAEASRGSPAGRLRVVDFGSGKSYLTFALHHLLTVVHGLEADVVGLDLKADVVADCEALAHRLGTEGLRFEVGDIAGYDALEGVDLVVSLHACDTATDAALDRAVRAGARVILAVPCCQHELLPQLRSPALDPLLRHGTLRERFAAEVTDAARAQLLGAVGYDVQVVEFVELEHTPKNVLLRAVARPGRDTVKAAADYRAFARELGIDPALERLLADRLPA
jgi:Methyltransferase domain